MSRYEVKLVGSERDYARVRGDLLLLPSMLVRDHHTRIVQSVYLDTSDGVALADNLAGISLRSKVRFRWYGEDIAAVYGQLEHKRRDNALGDKDVFAARQPIAVAGATRTQFVTALRAALPVAAEPLLATRQPAQWIRYRRDYLRSADGTMRVTIDRQLTAFDQRFEWRLQCRRATPLSRLLVVEIKADAAERGAIERWLQNVKLRPSKCSKFVLASAPAEGPPVSHYD